MQWKKILKPSKIISLLLFFIILIIYFYPAYYHSMCTNMRCEGTLFAKECYCGFLMQEFLVLVLISLILSLIITYIIFFIKNKIKK